MIYCAVFFIVVCVVVTGNIFAIRDGYMTACALGAIAVSFILLGKESGYFQNRKFKKWISLVALGTVSAVFLELGSILTKAIVRWCIAAAILDAVVMSVWTIVLAVKQQKQNRHGPIKPPTT